MREKNIRECSGNAKHRQYLKRRCYLEQNGLLNRKQHRRNRRNNSQNGKHKHSLQSERKDHSQAGAVFPRFTSSQHELCTYPSSSMQTHHGNSKTIEESTVPLQSASQGETLFTQYSVLPSLDNPLKYIALDCEMVGTGPKGHCSELARCSIVSYDGNVIYDKFIMPVNPVTDFRTRWSGVRARDLQNATPFEQAQKEILKILSGKVVVGHAIQNDFKVLHYFHPACFVRDTAHIPMLNEKAGLPVSQPASLKKLTKALLNKDIQILYAKDDSSVEWRETRPFGLVWEAQSTNKVGKKGHSSVDDAKATMELYKMVQVEWERTLASKPVVK